MKRKEKVGP